MCSRSTSISVIFKKNTLTKSNLEENGLVWLTLPGHTQPLIAEKSQWPEHKAAGHITSAVKNGGSPCMQTCPLLLHPGPA